MIPVTKSFIPPIEEYMSQVKRAYKNEWLTNRGVLVKELEIKLKDYLGVKHLTLTANGTLPIQISIKALELKGEIITTPFSYVASTSSIVWEGCTPIFADIHPEYLTIDEEKIEEKITNKTTAILAVHVFGNPCNIEAIEHIARKHNLKVIYDAAHCFGVKYKGKSIFNYGDISTCSFHATKIFHTGEGGCWITNNDHQDKLFYHHNLGHNGPEAFHGLGINAKMSELQAAMGLAVFNHLDEILEERKKVVKHYDELLSTAPLKKLKIRTGTEWNYHYYPVIFKTEKQLLKVQKELNSHDIYPRRYFYPSLNTLPYVQNQLFEVSESISSRVLCLPLFVTLDKLHIKKICKTINNVIEHA